MKIRKLINLLGKDGWYLYWKSGNVYQLMHPTKFGVITINGKKSFRLSLCTLRNILFRAGIL